MRRRLAATQDSIPFFKILNEEWEAYCDLADRPKSNQVPKNPYTGRRVRELWEEVDKSLPIILSDGNTGNLSWYIRILDHKGKGLILDIRQYAFRTDGVRQWYEPTDNGLSLPIGDWIKLFDPIFKLLKKWRR